MFSFLAHSMLQQAQDSPEQPWWFTLAPLIFIVFVFYFLMIRPQVKQQKEHQKLIGNLKKGDRVITSGGVWGEIEAVDQHTVRLKISDKTKVTVTRSHVSGFQPQPGDAPEEQKK
jgi:preprotein translocase subunit YajC